jgi:hypothetical protein
VIKLSEFEYGCRAPTLFSLVRACVSSSDRVSELRRARSKRGFGAPGLLFGFVRRAPRPGRRAAREEVAVVVRRMGTTR